MTSHPIEGQVPPRTPIYDETVEATAGHGSPAGSGDQRAGGAGQQAKDAAGTAKDQAKDTAGVAKDQAGQVAGTAKEAGSRVAGTAGEQASKVAKDALGQARDLYGQAAGRLSEQAGEQQDRAASTLRTLGSDLDSLQRGDGGGDGLAGELVRAISTRAERLGGWLEQREPAEVLDEVKQFAARRPGLFIALAAVGGVVAARATKALVAEAKPGHQAGAAGHDRGRTLQHDADGTRGTDGARGASGGAGRSSDTAGVHGVAHDPGTPGRPPVVDGGAL